MSTPDPPSRKRFGDASPPARLLVVAPNWLGDAVMALPLIADLHRAWPNTELTIAARRSVAPLFEMVPAVAAVLTLSGGGGRHALRGSLDDARRLAEGAFDAALLLPNSFFSAWLVWRANIAQRWGFVRDLRARLLTRRIARPATHVHQADYYLALGAGLGFEMGPRVASVIVNEHDRLRASTMLRDEGLTDNGRFIVFAPGAAYGRAKQWLPERFGELAAMLRERGLVTVLVGTADDLAVCRRIVKMAAQMTGLTASAQATAVRVINLAGKTDLRTLTGLFSLSDAVVSNDSGAMHLVAAVGARVVAIFGPTDDRRTSPLRAHADAPEPIVVTTDVWCRPCMLRECPIDHRCMTRISAQQVFEILNVGVDECGSG